VGGLSWSFNELDTGCVTERGDLSGDGKTYIEPSAKFHGSRLS